jgi:hypothetical protein
MTRIHTCLLLCILFFFHYKLAAQKEAAPGFIVTNSNDTIRGMILDKDWNISPQNIKFKAAGDQDYKTYSVTDIKAFSVDGSALYLSRMVLLDVSPTDVNKLIEIDLASVDLNKLYNDVYPPDTASRQVFIKELVKGNVSLYYHKDVTSKQHFFIQENNDAFTELILRKYRSQNFKAPNYSKTVTYENQVWLYEKFRTQLEVLMAKCPSLTEKIGRVAYTENELSDLVMAFNSCLNQPSQMLSVKSKSAYFSVALSAGFFTSNIVFKGLANPYNLQSADFGSYSNLCGGLSFIFNLEKRFQRHKIVNEVLWKKTKFSSVSELTRVNLGLPTTYFRNYNIDISYIKLNTAYRYHFLNSEKIKLFLEAALTNAWAVKMEATVYEEEKTSFHDYKSQANLFGDRKHEEGISVAAGGYYRGKYGIKFSYERTNGMSDYSYLESTVSSYYIFLNYMFGKPR